MVLLWLYLMSLGLLLGGELNTVLVRRQRRELAAQVARPGRGLVTIRPRFSRRSGVPADTSNGFPTGRSDTTPLEESET